MRERTARLLLIMSVAITSGLSLTHANDEVVVAVTSIVEHPSLDAVRDGLIEELEASGYRPGVNLELMFESAQGNPATASQIARKFVGEQPDVIVPISTPSAQAVVATTDQIPVVFSAVTDPVSAKLVTSLDQPNENVTGVSDLPPIDKQLDMIARISPNTSRLGVIYNAGEANSVALIELLKAQVAERGWTLVEAVAPRSSDVLPAVQSLVDKVDTIYVPTDNTVVTALEAIIKICVQEQIPLYAGDTDSVARGAIAAVSFNYRDVGKQTGAMVARLLGGERPADIPVENVQVTQLHVNSESAAQMGVTIPPDVLAEAQYIVD